MNKKMIFAGALILIVLLMSGVHALGLAPAKAVVDFVPGAESTISFNIINSGSRTLVLNVGAEGELAQYIEILNRQVVMGPEEGTRKVTYIIRLPQTLSPGLHTSDIVVRQSPLVGGEGAFVGASVAVAHQLHVNVPYPGKYLDIGIDTFQEKNGEIRFVIPLMSRGKLDISAARAEIEVFSPLNEKVADLSSDSIAIPSKERKDLSVSWEADVSPGVYRAVVNVFYDGEAPRTIEGEFDVGGDVLVITSLEVNGFSLGEIARFEAVVENLGESEVKGVFFRILVFDGNGNKLPNLESQRLDVEAFEEANLDLFWDTLRIEAGEYDSVLVLNFNGKSLEEEFTMDVSQDGIEIIGLSYGISEVSFSPGFELPNRNTVLIIVIVALVIVSLILFLLFRKKKKRR